MPRQPSGVVRTRGRALQRQFAFDRLAQILPRWSRSLTWCAAGRPGAPRRTGRCGPDRSCGRLDGPPATARRPPWSGRRARRSPCAAQVHHDRAVGASFPLAHSSTPITCACLAAVVGLAALSPAQQRVVADGQPDARGEPFAGAPTEARSQINRATTSARQVRRPRTSAPRQAVGEEPNRTRRGDASPPADANPQRDDRSDGGQVFQRADIRAMPRRRDAPARRARPLSGAVGHHDPVGPPVLNIRQAEQR